MIIVSSYTSLQHVEGLTPFEFDLSFFCETLERANRYSLESSGLTYLVVQLLSVG